MSNSQLPQLPAELLESLPEVIQQYIEALHGLIGAQQQVIDLQLPLLQKQLEEMQTKLSQYDDTDPGSAPGPFNSNFKRPTKKRRSKR